jgi:hypothetical protein
MTAVADERMNYNQYIIRAFVANFFFILSKTKNLVVYLHNN